MALFQRTRLIQNQRLDLPDYNNIEDFVCADFKAIHKNVWTNGNFVMSGFAATGTGTDTLSVAVANSEAMFGADDGVLFIGAPSLSPLTNNELVPSATNYVEIFIDQDTGGADSRAFWDPTANGGTGGEFAQIVDTFTFIKANFAINTSGFSGDADKLRLCEVDVNGSGTITAIRDARNMFWRLGRSGDTGYDYPWSSRTEPVVTDFTGADKDIANFKDWADAVMSSLKEVKGASYWFETPTGTIPGLLQVSALSVMAPLSSGAKISWNGSVVSITDNSGTPANADALAAIRIFDVSHNLRLTRQDGTGGSTTIAIADGEVLWVELPSPLAAQDYSGVGVLSSNYRVSARGSVPQSDKTYWLAYREGSKLIWRGIGELQTGESSEIGDNVPQTLLNNIGLTDETTAPSYSSNIRGVASQSIVARVGVLTDAIGDEQEDRSGYLRSATEMTWSGTTLSFSGDLVLQMINTKSGTFTSHTILAAQSPVTCNDTESLYVTITRGTSGNVTLTRSSVTPIPAQTQANKDVIVLFRRVDISGVAYLHMPFHKQLLLPGIPTRSGLSPGATSTANRMAFYNSSGFLTSDANLTYNGVTQTFGNGTSSTPGLAMVGSPTTGFFQSAVNSLGLSIAGTQKWTFANSGGPVITASALSAEGFFINTAITGNNGFISISGDSGSGTGRNFRMHGGSHATLANVYQSRRGTTVDFSISGAGLLTLGATGDNQFHVVNGAMTIDGGPVSNYTFRVVRGTAGVTNGAGTLQVTDVLTNNTEKQAAITTLHYNNSGNADVVLIAGYSQNGINGVRLGGGISSSLRAATVLGFYTEPSSTTGGGVLRGSIDGNGLWTIGTAAGTQTHAVNGDIGMTNAASNGTRLGIINTDTSGRHWRIVSTGSGDVDGAGHLKFYDVTGGGAAVMRLSTGAVVTSVVTSVTNATESTSTTTGALIVSGGVGIAKRLNVTGPMGLGGAYDPSIALYMRGGSVTNLTGTTQYGLAFDGQFDASVATNTVNGIYSVMRTNASAGTISVGRAFHAHTASPGTGAFDRLINFSGVAQTAGITGNAFIADNTTFTGNWSLHLTSLNPSYFAGPVRSGTLSAANNNDQSTFFFTLASGNVTQANAAGVNRIVNAQDLATTGFQRVHMAAYLRTITASQTDTSGRTSAYHADAAYTVAAAQTLTNTQTMGWADYFAGGIALSGAGALALTHSSSFYVASNSTNTGAAGANKYGLYVGNLSGTSNNYSVYTGSAMSSLGGALGLRKGADVNSSGTPFNSFANDNSYYRITGSTPAIINGISGFVVNSGDRLNGRILRIYNNSGQPLTVVHASGSAGLSDQIFTPDGTNQVLSGNGFVEFMYDLDQTRWYLVNMYRSPSEGSSLGINYVPTAGSNAEAGVGTWVRYADASAAVPVDGVGGSPNAAFTFATTTTNPLRGTNSFLLTKDANDRRGHGVSIPFTIDRADLAKVVSIEFDYEPGTGFAAGSDTVDSDVEVYIIKDPTGTPVVIQPTPYKLTAGVGVQGKYKATFQTDSSGTSYSLVFHVATTSATAWTLKFDNVRVGPQEIVQGTPATDWVSYTPIVTGLGTGSASSSAKWRRVGDSIEIQASITKDGSNGTGAVAIAATMPAGLTVDSAKTDSVSNRGCFGSGVYITTGFTREIHNPFIVPSTSLIEFANPETGNTFQGADFDANRTLHFSIKIPVLGWSANTFMSNDADTRVVAASYVNNATQNITGSAETPIDFGTKIFDTHNAVVTTAPFLYRAPVSGYYKVHFHVRLTTATASQFYLAVNGNRIFDNNGSGASAGFQGSTVIYRRAGETISPAAFHATTDRVLDNASNTIYIERLTGPSLISATETVAMRYTSASGQSFTNNVTTTFLPTTKDYDTHGAFNTGTGVFTCPVAGLYELQGTTRFNNTFAGGTRVIADINLNGGLKTRRVFNITGSHPNPAGHINDTIKCNAGDTLSFSVNQDGASPGTLTTTSTENYLVIKRVG